MTTVETDSSLVGMFGQLSLPEPGSGANLFRTRLIPRCEHHRLGKDSEGNAAILVALDVTRPLEPRAPVVLENISVLHSVECGVEGPEDGVEQGTFSVLRCTSTDGVLRELFIRLVGAVVRDLPSRLSPALAAEVVEQLVQLFRSMRKPSTRSVQGLWAELLLVASASTPEALVRAWRVDPTETFDFSTETCRLEIKSTRRRLRSHLFSLQQLTPSSGVNTVVASVFVEPASGGPSLRDLWDTVRARLVHDAATRLRLDRIVMNSLGRAWRRALHLRFDQQLARDSIRFYDACQIPRVEKCPSEISEVHFRSNMMQVRPLRLDELVSRGDLFAAAILRI